MSSYGAESDHISNRFSGNTTIPAARISWEAFNGPEFDPPDGEIWARPSIQSVPFPIPRLEGAVNPGPVGLGSTAPSHREGLIVVELFAPRSDGLDSLKNFVEETMEMFHRTSFGTDPVVECRDADSPVVAGNDESGEYFKINVIIPYYVQD